jgi:hypothetical protein
VDAAALEAGFHLLDALLEGFEFGGLGLDGLLAGGTLETRGGLVEESETNRSLSFSSRSATLFSMRKMSMSSWEKVLAMVLGDVSGGESKV